LLAAARLDGTIADMAARLHLSQGTVRNRVEAVKVAEEKGRL
jgi:DNA-binding Lrp family transcriptional regulator